MRIIEVNDQKVLKLLNERKEISVRQLAITLEYEKLEEEYNKNLALYARIDEKVRPLMDKITTKLDLGEYEERTRVYQDEKDLTKWFIEIADRMDEFKSAWEHRNDPKEEPKQDEQPKK